MSAVSLSTSFTIYINIAQESCVFRFSGSLLVQLTYFICTTGNCGKKTAVCVFDVISVKYISVDQICMSGGWSNFARKSLGTTVLNVSGFLAFSADHDRFG